MVEVTKAGIFLPSLSKTQKMLISLNHKKMFGSTFHLLLVTLYGFEDQPANRPKYESQGEK
jgi:hypothetical protein